MKILDFNIKIPTYENGSWTETEFTDIIDFREFLKPLFKEPGKYEFDELSKMFNGQGRAFNKNKIYCYHAFNTKDYIKFWDEEKAKCKNGAIFKHNGKTWYIPRDYYMWLNFLPIYDKMKKKFDFPQVWDVQYHMALYEILAEVHFKHVSIFKKRQIASSYFHCAKLINRLWFDQGVILKMGASLKDYINLEGSWKFLEEYKDFLNQNTAWYRPMDPNKVLTWQQRIETTSKGRKTYKGLKGMLQGMSFEQSATKGVGGPCTIFFYEEAGIAKQLDKTYEYVRPAMQAGELTTGLFIAAGSVGELSDAGPLEEFTYNPIANDIYPVYTNLLDEDGTEGYTGLFIPEHWGMPPYIDEYGNSQPELALEALNKQYEEWKKTLRPDQYQRRISQYPRNIKEGFAHREISIFPTSLIEMQKKAITDGEYPYEVLELDEGFNKEIVVKKSNKAPIVDFPVKLNAENKEGAIQVWERPDKNAPWGTYLASIDPVSDGKTITSESLCSIYIYKTGVMVRKHTETGTETYIEGDKIVACWCGRFDDINDTHKRLRLMLEWYNAWGLCEANVSLFIRYMMKENKQKYLVPKSEMIFLKEAKSNTSTYQEYGWKNTGNIFKGHLLIYLVEWLKEVIDTDTLDDGTIKKKYFGINRIPDKMALTEMLKYKDGMNVDRLISLAALIAFIKIRESNVKVPVREEYENNLENTENLTKLSKGAFHNIGRSNRSVVGTNRKSGFKNLR